MTKPKKRVSPFKKSVNADLLDEQQMELIRKFKTRGLMTALDLTRDQPEETRELCVQVAMATVREVCLTLEGGSSVDDHGYYLIVNNKVTRKTPTLSSSLVSLFDDVNT